MPRQQYVNGNRRQKPQNRGQFVLVMISFVTGYLSSSIMNINQLGNWLNENMTVGESLKLATSAPVAPTQTMAKTSNSPKLEFYTMLTKEPKGSVPVGTELAKMVRPTQRDDAPVAPLDLTVAKPQNLAAKSVEVHAAKPIMVKPPVSTAFSSTKKTIFVVQLASFHYKEQAERHRAKLLLKGFDVKISEARQGDAHLFRVMLGPYANLSEAQKAKVIFQAKEHSSGMIRQMDA
jgi:cell division protein FtsN